MKFAFASLEGVYPGLPRAQCRIVDCPRGGVTTWGLFRQEDLVRAAGVSVATLIRFVRQQGYGGFPAFREAIRAERVSRGGGQRLLEVSGGPSDLVAQVVRLDQTNLQAMLGILGESLLQEAVDRLETARQRLLLGFRDRGDSPLAQVVDLHLWVPCENVLYRHRFGTFVVLSHALASCVAHGDRASRL